MKGENSQTKLWEKADCYYVYSVFSVVQYNQIVFL